MGVILAIGTSQSGSNDQGELDIDWYPTTANINDGDDTTFETTDIVTLGRNVGAPGAQIRTLDYTDRVPDGTIVTLRWKWKAEWWDFNDSSPVDTLDIWSRYSVGAGFINADQQTFSTDFSSRTGSIEDTIIEPGVLVPDGTLLKVELYAAWRARSGVHADEPPDYDTIFPDIKVTVYACEVIVPTFVGGSLI